MVQREEGFGGFSRSDGDEKIQKCAGNLTQFSGDFVLRVSGDSILLQNHGFDMADNDVHVCMYNMYVCTYMYIYVHTYIIVRHVKPVILHKH